MRSHWLRPTSAESARLRSSDSAPRRSTGPPASCLGLLAARAAIAGAQPTVASLTGPRGLVALTSPDNPVVADLHRVPIREGIRDAAVRLFPVTGFAHSAVLGTTIIRARATAPAHLPRR